MQYLHIKKILSKGCALKISIICLRLSGLGRLVFLFEIEYV